MRVTLARLLWHLAEAGFIMGFSIWVLANASYPLVEIIIPGQILIVGYYLIVISGFILAVLTLIRWTRKWPTPISWGALTVGLMGMACMLPAVAILAVLEGFLETSTDIVLVSAIVGFGIWLFVPYCYWQYLKTPPKNTKKVSG